MIQQLYKTKTTSLATLGWQDMPGSESLSLAVVPQTDPVTFFRLVKP